MVTFPNFDDLFEAEFDTRVADVLPDGTVEFVLVGDQLRVEITWSEDRLDDGAAQVFVVNTGI